MIALKEFEINLKVYVEITRYHVANIYIYARLYFHIYFKHNRDGQWKIRDNEGSLMPVNENSVRKLTVMLIKMYNTHARKKFLEKRARIMSRVIASRTSILRT